MSGVIKGTLAVCGGLAFLIWILPESSKDAPARPTRNIGDQVAALGTSPWICGSTKDAVDDAMKWAVRGDNEEVGRSLAKSHSALLKPGVVVKVLDSSFMLMKVRLPASDPMAAMLAPDRECWVPREAVGM